MLVSPASARRRGAPAPAARPLRVVQVLHTVAYGGVEKILLDWAGAVDPARADMLLVCFANPGETEAAFVDAAARAGIPVRTIPWGRSKPVLRAARALIGIVREFGADIIHTHNVYAEIVGWLASRITGCKAVTTVYVWADFGWKRNVQQWVASRLLRRFDLVTSQSAATMEDTIARGVPAAIQKVLVTGISPAAPPPDSASRDALRRQHGCGPEHVVLVNVARFYPEKAQDRLLDCFAEIVRERPATRLWMMGVGPLEAALKQQVLELGIRSQVAFTGFVADIAPTLAASDIQVHPSRAEGIPLALCAGMASGMPIIATAVGGVPEIITSGETGILIAEWDRAAFIASTLALIDDAAERSRLGAAARRTSETSLSLASAANQLASTYEEVAAR